MLKEIIRQYLEDDNEVLKCLLKFFLERVTETEVTERTEGLLHIRRQAAE